MRDLLWGAFFMTMTFALAMSLSGMDTIALLFVVVVSWLTGAWFFYQHANKKGRIHTSSERNVREIRDREMRSGIRKDAE
jgi:hypothetical protein